MDTPAGSVWIACAASILVLATFLGLEAANFVGERAANSLYAFLSFVILSASTGWLGWLVIAELVRDADTQRQTSRRRIAWLVGCMAVLAAMRPLAGRDMASASGSGWMQVIETSVPGASLSAWSRLFWGVVLAIIATSYALLRWRRMRKEPLGPGRSEEHTSELQSR